MLDKLFPKMDWFPSWVGRFFWVPLAAGCAALPGGGAAGSAPLGASGMVVDTLLKTELEGVDDTEVVVTYAEFPPHTTLPKHWHPGEEFAYVLEGSATLWQEGKPDTLTKKGDVVKVPPKQVHTAITGDEGVKLVIFRVQEKGQPERVLVE